MKIKKILIKTLLIILISFVAVYAQNSTNFSVTRNIKGNARNPGEINTITFRVMENDNTLYTIDSEVDYDIPFPAFKVFNDGSGVIINSFQASLTFFNNDGSEITKEKIMKDPDVAYERSVYSYISGDQVAISLLQPEINYSIIQVYDKRGQLIHNWQLNEKHINGLAYSHIDQILVLSVYDWYENNLKKSTRFFEANGREISKIPYNFTKGEFSASDKIFVGYTNEKCFVYDTEKNRLNLEQAASENKMILLAQYINGKVFMLQAHKPYLENGKWYYKNPTISSFEINGTLNFDSGIKCDAFAEYKLAQSGSDILLKTENQTVRIK